MVDASRFPAAHFKSARCRYFLAKSSRNSPVSLCLRSLSDCSHHFPSCVRPCRMTKYEAVSLPYLMNWAEVERAELLF